MTTLAIHDFGDFHRAVHGVSPFPWQERLLAQVVEERAWPAVIDLPTGAGKTTCIDIALFALALNASGRSAGWCPRRIALIVDRRVVVDQVAERGRRLRAALTVTDPTPVVAAVAARLSELTGGAGDPIGVFTLRGGMPRDDGWARTPEQPLILASTVDHFGSRLLVQGYGVSDSMRPVHAGLLANDVLLFLDEVHLSRPFAETLSALERLRQRFLPGSGMSKRFHHSFLSATPGESVPRTFRVTTEDTAPGTELGTRVHANKPVRLVDVSDRTALESACVREARALLQAHDVIAVITNRVGSASSIVQTLRNATPAPDADVALLTGRMRPLDRDAVVANLRSRIATGRDRSAVSKKLIVVGTQSLEAGADFDFDALVTEGASLDALRQRFGRVDRLGAYGRAEGVIIRDKSVKSDPVYEESANSTIAWLKEQTAAGTKRVDLGVMALPTPPPDRARDLMAPRATAPVLLPAYMDAWLQTSPRPAAVPDVSLWLHGPKAGPADVQVVWRSDLDDDILGDAELATAIVSAIAPSGLEAISVPYVVARRWLAGGSAPEVSDVEGQASDEGKEEAAASAMALRWNGSESRVIANTDLRPGDTIIVPSTRGGIADHSFDPLATVPVTDLAERAGLLARGVPALRIRPDVLAAFGLPSLPEEWEEARGTLQGALDTADLSGWRRTLIEHLLASRPRVVVVQAAQPYRVLQGSRLSPTAMRRLLAMEASAEDGVETTTDPDTSSYAGRAITLARHCTLVERLARTFAMALGLPDELVADVALAAWIHDIGKADRRFQILLRGGSEIDFYKDETPLAKSGMPPGAAAAHELARRRSGFPRGARHELLSVAMAESHPDLLARANDPDLVLHLLASHHGFCRPLAPVVPDDAEIDVALAPHVSDTFGAVEFGPIPVRHGLDRLDRPVADRFWGSARKYGWLELCGMEAALRLADHRASEMEQNGVSHD